MAPQQDGKYYAVKFMKKHEIIKLKQAWPPEDTPQVYNQEAYLTTDPDNRRTSTSSTLPERLEPASTGGEATGSEKDPRWARKFSDEQSKFYGLQAWSEVKEGKNIIHRDLKPENILLCPAPKGLNRRADAGKSLTVAAVASYGTRTYTLCGTPEYIAPEVLLNKGHGKPVDWWTLGILIYEMICGQPPFCDEDPMGIYQKILAGKVYFPKYFDKNAKSLVSCLSDVKKLLVADLSKRFGNLKDGAADILQNKWFSTYELPKLEALEYPAPYKPAMKDENDISNFEEPRAPGSGA
ncbi:cAMP-dependent protein kinase catalytic subunit (Dd GPK2) (DdPK3) [Durusdinium trenchii]|uniref:cAMP-dependent protein kinase catalytic subunit (Dd GPK2) (DdPK3) n=1 Tax=Durusdinium trenchii TaxID=1381693 RepID=A0ABP0SD00_9DINO